MNNVLVHYGVKGMKWGVRRFQNKDGGLTNAGKHRLHLRRKVVDAIKTTKDANDIVESLTFREKQLLGAPTDKDIKWIAKNEELSRSANIAKRIVIKHKDLPVSFLEIWDNDSNKGEIAIATRSGKEYRGKGYASEAVKRGLDWYNKYGSKRLEQLEWWAHESNTGSNALAKKYGFKQVKRNEPAYKGWNYYTYSKSK